MNETNYRIKYRKGDFEVEVQGDKDWVEKKFEQLVTEKVVPKAVTVTEEAIGLPASLVEFLKQKGEPKKHIDRITVFGYWLFHKKNVRNFNVRDFEKCYSESRITEPSNISDQLNRAQAKGYFRVVDQLKDGLKTWTITLTGERYVDRMKG